MRQLDKLREALDEAPEVDEHHLTATVDADMASIVYQAARDYLALLESDALVIKRDSAGNWPMWLLERIKEKTGCDPWNVQAAIESALADSSKAPE